MMNRAGQWCQKCAEKNARETREIRDRLGRTQVCRVLGPGLSRIEVGSLQMHAEDLSSGLRLAHPLARELQGGDQVGNGCRGCCGQNGGDALFRQLLRDGGKGLLRWLIKGMAPRAMHMNVDEAWGNQASAQIDLLDLAA